MSALAPCLMIQGTGSGVGKSLLTAALCRLFARAGYRVAPFKSQNMSLNAAVTAEGGEIGRAQAAQAEAAGIEPTLDMNPVLLKPEDDWRSQVIVRGEVRGHADFHEYARMQAEIFPVVEESLLRLRRQSDLVLIEGAGSPAELNLRDRDIANMAVAHLADAPVLLAGDIDRGGMFAAVVGTLALLEGADRRRIAGIVVNKFRGDRTLLEPGLAALMRRTGVPVLGVVPYLDERLMPAEDSLDLEGPTSPGPRGALEVVVARTPRIANFDDFEPLATEPAVRVRFAVDPVDLAGADLRILPGSKNTMADLGWLRQRGLAEAFRTAAVAGAPVLGICGGYQMLGRLLRDPHRVESTTAVADGLGLLPVVTTFLSPKTTRRVEARGHPSSKLFGAASTRFAAYEIHHGHTERQGRQEAVPPVFQILSRGGQEVADVDGAVGPFGSVEGTYLHGVFGNPVVRRALLRYLARRRTLSSDPRWGAMASDPYERLADLVGPSLDMPAVARLVGLALPHPRVVQG